MSDKVTTSDLACWFGMSRAGVIKALRAAGVEPLGETRERSRTRWPRQAAVSVLSARARRLAKHAEHADV